MNDKPHIMQLEFPTKKEAIEFQDWLCGGGEQAYWEHQDIIERQKHRIDYKGYDGSKIIFARGERDENS